VPQERFDPGVEVIPAALAHNVAQVRRLTGRPILAVVKNNAYGLDLVHAARLLEPMDPIEGFAVVRTAEAIALREAGIRKPMLLMARAVDRDADELVARGVSLAIYADDDPRRLAPVARARGPITAHLYIDTGLSRMGIPYHRALPFMREVRQSGAFRVAGSFMTFTEDAAFDPEQLRRFADVAAQARSAGLELGRLHAASSHPIFHFPDAATSLDMVRPGIALYGAYPERPEEEQAKAELRVAFRLRARVVRVERLRPGDGVSYGRRYVADRPVWTATLPVGHSDGYPREAVKGARVLIGGRTYPVIGAVSASHAIVEVGEEQTVRVGDVATLLGPDDPAIHPNAVAGATGVSVYDLLMHLSPLLPRVEGEGR
jgi:alanine racemase